MTAGDLIRRELENGATALGLAKRLAGSTDDANANVKRWRYVVMRAARGAEPAKETAALIAQMFGEEVEPPRRRSPTIDLVGRLEELAVASDDVLANQKDALTTQEEMLAELRWIHEALDTLLGGAEGQSTRSGGRR